MTLNLGLSTPHYAVSLHNEYITMVEEGVTWQVSLPPSKKPTHITLLVMLSGEAIWQTCSESTEKPTRYMAAGHVSVVQRRGRKGPCRFLLGFNRT